jgi:hypothetical protein
MFSFSNSANARKFLTCASLVLLLNLLPLANAESANAPSSALMTFWAFTRNIEIVKNSTDDATDVRVYSTPTTSQVAFQISDKSADPAVEKMFQELSPDEKKLFFERRNMLISAAAEVLRNVSKVQTFGATVTEKVREGVYRIKSLGLNAQAPIEGTDHTEKRREKLFSSLEQINETMFLYALKVVKTKEVQLTISLGAGFTTYFPKIKKWNLDFPGVKAGRSLGLGIGIGYNFETKSGTFDIFSDTGRFYKQYIPVVSAGAHIAVSIRSIFGETPKSIQGENGYSFGIPALPFSISSFPHEMSVNAFVPGVPSVTAIMAVGIGALSRIVLFSLDISKKALRISNFEVSVPIVRLKFNNPRTLFRAMMSKTVTYVPEIQAEADVVNEQLAVDADAAVEFLAARKEKFLSFFSRRPGPKDFTCAEQF